MKMKAGTGWFRNFGCRKCALQIAAQPLSKGGKNDYIWFFNAIDEDRKYNAEDFAKYFDKIIGNGVFANPSTSLQVSEHDGMRIKVAPGRGWIDCHYINNDADEILTVEESDMVLDRIDRVVMRLDRREDVRSLSLVVKQGTAAQTPVAPSLQRDHEIQEYSLAEILVPKKSVAIGNAQITDTRMNKNVCGYVSSLIDQVDTTTLYQQIQADLKDFREVNQADFEAWIAYLNDLLDENAVGNLMNLIEQNAQAIRELEENGSGDAEELIEKHAKDTDNPHKVSKSQVGLGNVDNTSDASKPISTATQTALDGKLSLAGGTVTGDTVFTGNLKRNSKEVMTKSIQNLRDSIEFSEDFRIATSIEVAPQFVKTGNLVEIYFTATCLKELKANTSYQIARILNNDLRPYSFAAYGIAHANISELTFGMLRYVEYPGDLAFVFAKDVPANTLIRAQIMYRTYSFVPD